MSTGKASDALIPQRYHWSVAAQLPSAKQKLNKFITADNKQSRFQAAQRSYLSLLRVAVLFCENDRAWSQAKAT